MSEADALKLVQDAIWSVIVGSGPAVGAAMLVGIAIALIQALTQVQEATLTFVPKILAVFGALLLLAGPAIFANADACRLLEKSKDQTSTDSSK